MIGQWTGRYKGTNRGLAVADLDDVGSEFDGAVTLFDDNWALPGAHARMRIPKGTSTFKSTIDVVPFHQPSAQFVSKSDFESAFPEIAFPGKADVEFEFLSDGSVRIAWSTNVGSKGAGRLRQSKSESPSQYRPVRGTSTWAGFKRFIDGMERDRYIFRGQPLRSRLRTAFHRTNRSNLVRFAHEDIDTVSRHIGAVIRHVFDFSRDTGALYNLIQHHGYPTPLLDWTRSPFIAAYFAYRSAGRHPEADEFVRIFIFDQKEWRKDFNRFDLVSLIRPHFSVLELVALENPRMVPQQALSTLTNIDDVEGHIRSAERRNKKTYLRVVDLPTSSRAHAMGDLNVMGITAGGLFPGLDGACEELRGRFFGL